MKAAVAPPLLVVELGGRVLSEADARALGQVRVRQVLSLPSQCELTFVDPEGPLGAGRGLEAGTALRVSVAGGSPPLFEGEATAVEFRYGPGGGREVRLRGYDLLHRLRKRQPVRAHVDVDLTGLARQLTADLGLEVEAHGEGPVWCKLVQHRQSDLELLVEAAERCGLYLDLRGKTLHLFSLEGMGEAVALGLGDRLLEARIDVNTDPACRSVTAWGWDPWLAVPHGGQAARPRSGRQVAAQAPPATVGGSGERTLADAVVQDDAQAQALAQAELDRRSAGEVTLAGVTEGDPRLRPGTPVTIEGVAEPLAGRYVLTAVTHTADRRRGFLSEIDTAPPPPHPRAAQAVTSFGRVTRVDDPKARGRIKARLPAYADLETDWLEVLLPGAGADKGLVAIPDVDDRVLVLFAQGDPAQGVVLGGVYGDQTPADEAGVEGGAVRRFSFSTPGGQRIRLDDERQRVRVENRGGNYVQVTPGTVRLGNSSGSFVELGAKLLRIHADTGLELEAPGQAIVIRAASVDFEQG